MSSNGVTYDFCDGLGLYKEERDACLLFEFSLISISLSFLILSSIPINQILTMSSSITKLLTLSSLITFALAIPNVTVVPASGGCAAYPAYDSSSGIAGPWTIALSSSENPDIEDFGDNAQLFRTAGETGIHEGSVRFASPLRLNQ